MTAYGEVLMATDTGLFEPVEHLLKILAGELPLERPGDLLVATAERQQCALERVEVGEVVGLQRFAAGRRRSRSRLG